MSSRVCQTGGYRDPLARQRAGGYQAAAGDLEERLPRRLVGVGLLHGVSGAEVRAHHAQGRERGVAHVHRQRKGTE